MTRAVRARPANLRPACFDRPVSWRSPLFPVAELVRSRELLAYLTLRELRGRYKRSALGWGWSLLNPLASMAIYTFVFSFVFKLRDNRPIGHPSGISSYPVYLLAGLLAWNFFNITIGTSMSSMIGNGSLVKKAAFPRSAIVLATVAAQLMTFLIELGLLSVVVLALRHMVLPFLPIALVLIVLLAMFTSGLALVMAGLNVYLRDLQHLWTLFAQMLFYATPIVYPVSLVHEGLRGRRAWVRRVYDANPVGVFVRAFRNVFFDLRVPPATTFGALLAMAVASMLIGFAVFSKLERRLAEEL